MTLTAQHLTDGWSVVDDEGGRWWPNEETAAQIEANDEPAVEAVRICEEEPMRGIWKQ